MSMNWLWYGAMAVFVVGCQSPGAPSAVGFLAPPAPIIEIDLAPVQLRLEAVELSGARTRDGGAERLVAMHLETAFSSALSASGVQASTKPLPPESLALARHVLRSVDPDRTDRAHLPLLNHWAIEIPLAAEREAPPILIVFAEARINTAGHRLAQAGLSAALLSPNGIDGGSRRTHAGLFDSETGELLWAGHTSDGDVRTEVGAQLVADALVARLTADMQ
ncbi:MAG: hypothetical protein AAF638_14215 [Pseudomonadota bacterium]